MELGFTLVMLIPLAFFGGCALTLWRLMLCAIPERKRLAALAPAARSAGKRAGETAPSQGKQASNLPRFALLIPAHNEELLLGEALSALNRLDYPADAYRLVVIADNCTDRTAAIAREHGAIALERFDTVDIGKGYALEWALHKLLCAKPARSSASENAAVGAGSSSDPLAEIADFDAVVILDADTLVAPNMLRAFAAGMAGGQKVMQARYEVLNAGDTWRTRLMTCALALAHIVKPLGRERLGLSDGLKGNGMCFAREVVETVPWSGESITEDIEYTLRLCRAGYRVAFLPETAVWAQMPTSGAQSVSQRKRWEGGRYRLLFTVAPQLLREGWAKRSRILRDRAAELIIPPFAEMFAVPLLLLLVCGAAALGLHWSWAAGLMWAWAGVLLLQAGYLFGGMWVAKVPASIALSALCAPGYIVWKFGVYAIMIASRSAGGWKRTERHKLE